MSKVDPFKYFKTSPEIIQLAVMYYVRFPLSLRQVEDILHERGIDVCHESVRYWSDRFGAHFAKKIRSRKGKFHSNWKWHIDEVFVKVRGKQHYLWRAVDQEGNVLECFVSKRRNKLKALKILKKLLKNYGAPNKIVTDKLGSYRAALRELGILGKHETGQYKNNQCENSHSLPDSGLASNHEKVHFRRRERAMCRFRSMASLQ